MAFGAVSKILLLIVLLVGFAGNIIALAGIAKLTDLCNGTINMSSVLDSYPGSTLAFDCGIYYSLDWWLVCYQVFITLWAVLAIFINFLHRKDLLLWFFAISTTLWSNFAFGYIRASYRMKENSGGQADGVKAAAAGAVATLVANYLWAWIYSVSGKEPETNAAAEPAKA